MSSPLVFKTAADDWEMDQIHRLNYKTFVEEIPQHPPNAERRLVDKFHPENTYLICLCDRQVVGMMAVRGTRPFSIDQKLPGVDSYLPRDRKPCEIRLLAVEKDFRYGQVFKGLLALLWQHGIEQGYTLALISGTTRQVKLYQHLGFTSFGPRVGTGDAMFQPMYVTLETFEAGAREFLRTTPARSFQRNIANFLPGPVGIHREVGMAFEQKPESHRGEKFVAEFQELKSRLRELTRARHVEILLGSGTLGNDAVAGQLSLERKPGLVLSNGEFGERLVDQARRWKLDCEVVKLPWGKPFDLAAIKRRVGRANPPAWIWCPHCETSTGVLNDLAALKALCAANEIKLCLDCISSIGTVPVNLEGVFLASCASGKGLAAYPGLAVVFYNHKISPAPADLPRYLDLGYYAEQNGVPFTHSSNLINALQVAVERVDWEKRFVELAEVSAGLRMRLRELGFEVIGAEAQPSPAAVTMALPPGVNSVKLGQLLYDSGYLLSFNSDYLRRRNWIQICLMGEFTREKLNSMVKLLHHLYELAKTAAAKAAPSAGVLRD